MNKPSAMLQLGKVAAKDLARGGPSSVRNLGEALGTTGPRGGIAERFISTFVATIEATHPRIHCETVTVADLKESAKTLEDGKVNVAVVRSDVSPPNNGRSLIILRRAIVAIVLPPNSKMKARRSSRETQSPFQQGRCSRKIRTRSI